VKKEDNSKRGGLWDGDFVMWKWKMRVQGNTGKISRVKTENRQEKSGLC
jgi:hypothetical protein